MLSESHRTGAQGWPFSSSCAVFLWFCNHSAQNPCQGCDIASNQKADGINSGIAEFTAAD